MKACELVGVSRRTIYNWLSSGKIEYVRTAGGSVRIFVDTLWRDARVDRGVLSSMAGRRSEPGVMPRAFGVEGCGEDRWTNCPNSGSFHRLNNQLGISSRAELLESKATTTRAARATGYIQHARSDGHGERDSPRLCGPHRTAVVRQKCNFSVKSLTSFFENSSNY